MASFALLFLLALDRSIDSIVPVDPRLLFEGFLELVVGRRERRADCHDDVVARPGARSCELQVAGIRVWLGIGLVDLNLWSAW